MRFIRVVPSPTGRKSSTKAERLVLVDISLVDDHTKLMQHFEEHLMCYIY